MTGCTLEGHSQPATPTQAQLPGAPHSALKYFQHTIALKLFFLCVCV